MRLVGLTGGIGSGKSTVSERLGEHGAVVIDADAVVRELQRPGQAVFDEMVKRWGEKILDGEGALDRGAVAGIVFADADELKALEAIVHPVLREEITRRIEAQSDRGNVVILDMALIAEKRNPYGVEEIIVVDLPTGTAIDRLVAHRGFSRDDAEKRVAAQVTREERRELADHVIDNSGTLDALIENVDELWKVLTTGV